MFTFICVLLLVVCVGKTCFGVCNARQSDSLRLFLILFSTLLAIVIGVNFGRVEVLDELNYKTLTKEQINEITPNELKEFICVDGFYFYLPDTE